MKKIICTIIIFITLTCSAEAQWVAQSLPVSPELIYCVKFWNKNTGWMSTGNSTAAYSPQILKTTNEGNNWSVIRNNMRIYSFQIMDSITIYGYGRMNGYNMIYRTFDGGASWDSVSYSNGYTYTGLYFFDKDTGCVGASDGNWGYILRTTNGGTTLNQIYKATSHSTFGEQLTFFKEKVNGEYYGYCLAGGAYMFKTTNSGYNWTQIAGGLNNFYLNGYYFLNKDTGWVSNLGTTHMIQFTTNGGINWANQYISLFSNYYPNGIYFSSYNKGWAGASDGYLVYATTNGGQTWGRQITPNNRTGGLIFLDSLNGWNYGGFQSAPYMSKTTNGGGVILGIIKDSSTNNTPKYYTLKQNYPNPFNNSTIIEYSITKKSTIGINIYDVSGRSVYDMTANNLEPGYYKLSLDFGVLNLPSGIYFYKFIVVNQNGVQMFSETKKLMYVK